MSVIIASVLDFNHDMRFYQCIRCKILIILNVELFVLNLCDESLETITRLNFLIFNKRWITFIFWLKQISKMAINFRIYQSSTASNYSILIGFGRCDEIIDFHVTKQKWDLQARKDILLKIQISIFMHQWYRYQVSVDNTLKRVKCSELLLLICGRKEFYDWQNRIVRICAINKTIRCF